LIVINFARNSRKCELEAEAAVSCLVQRSVYAGQVRRTSVWRYWKHSHRVANWMWSYGKRADMRGATTELSENSFCYLAADTA